ncbi:high-affinity iron permease [Exophiala xenobiotica]|nr:high-affinity iron permease [Exophiala xenobiotica]KAK5192216.1 high-affinity iron permease [Exophiala xenobiotica]KAK5305017.1 high-affinity iron permease [Exophiala xenobiotica]KAK5435552.1 high-affinity iron permease [Exophiala xenobiotica]KAK5549199.1 high-affinity iron permease [Chaetothyriales sp. CCFEE 6169]
MTNVFGVQIFFIIFRECLEAVIIVSVLLSFLKQSLGQPDQDPAIYKRLKRQVWAGSLSGIAIALIIGGAFIGVFYGLGHDLWSESEDLWEGIFYLIASIIITVMGLAILRINKTKEKWRVKIAQALVAKSQHRDAASRFGEWTRRYAMFLLPFITTLREGLEAVVFVGGVSLGLPATAFPIPVITGILAGLLVGYLIYRGGNYMTIQYFLIASTCVLYLIAAGMFSKSIWSLQFYKFAQLVGGDVAESGDGPGSYNIDQTVWHVNCCNPERDHGWDVFNAILGWQNTATYGSVISYNIYWLFIMVCVSCMLYEERTGALPLQKSFLRFLSKIPGFKSYANRKLNTHKQDAADIISKVQADTFSHGVQRPLAGN